MTAEVSLYFEGSHQRFRSDQQCWWNYHSYLSGARSVSLSARMHESGYGIYYNELFWMVTWLS